MSAPLLAGAMLSPAQAAPFDPGHYPDSTKVFFHLDLEKPLLKDCGMTLDKILPEEVGSGSTCGTGPQGPSSGFFCLCVW